MERTGLLVPTALPGLRSRRKGDMFIPHVSTGPDLDNIACGRVRIAMPWLRLVGLMAAAWITALAGAMLALDPVRTTIPDKMLRTLPDRQPITAGKVVTPTQSGSKHRLAFPTGPIPSFCGTGRSNPAEIAALSLPALVGTASRLTFDTGPPESCLVKDKTDTQIPFAMCLLRPEQDQHVSDGRVQGFLRCSVPTID